METHVMNAVGQMKSGHSVHERYTESARNAISHARQEARRRGSSVITVADLLAGLGVDENTRAERIGSLKENAFYLRWLAGLPRFPVQASNAEIVPAQPELDAEAKRALAYAVAEADRDREYWIDSDHLLRGLLRFPNKAHFAILKTELNLAAARLASHEDRTEHLPDETPSIKVIQYLVRKHIAVWGPPALSLACYLYILIQTFHIGMFATGR